MGPTRHIDFAGPVLVAGVAGALTDDLRPGDIVVGSELRTFDASYQSHAAALVFDAVRRLGLRARLAPVLSIPRVADGRDRAALAALGAVAVDTESAYLAAQAPHGQTVAVRAIVDTPGAPLLHPGILRRGIIGLRALRAAAPAINQWAAAVSDREIVSATMPDDACDLTVIGSADELDLCVLVGARRVGIAEDASQLRADVVRCLSGLGRVSIVDRG